MTWSPSRPTTTVDCPYGCESFKDWDAYFSHMDVIHPGWRVSELQKSNLPSLRDMAKTWGRYR